MKRLRLLWALGSVDHREETKTARNPPLLLLTNRLSHKYKYKYKFVLKIHNAKTYVCRKCKMPIHKYMARENVKNPQPLPLTTILYHEAYTWGLHYPCIVGWLLLRTFNYFNFYLASSCFIMFTGLVFTLHIWRTVSKLTPRPLGLIETKLSENTNWAKS